MADGLKVLDLKRPIREADISEGPGMGWTGRAPALRASMLVRGSERHAMPKFNIAVAPLVSILASRALPPDGATDRDHQSDPLLSPVA